MTADRLHSDKVYMKLYDNYFLTLHFKDSSYSLSMSSADCRLSAI